MAYDSNNPDYAALRGLSMVWLRAVALAWTDDEVGKKFRALLRDDPERALEEYFNYKCPFSIKLRVNTAEPTTEHPGWVPAKGGKPGYWKLPPNKIVFGVPSKPAPIYDEAVALAAYVEGGPSYLFSCC
jgi:ribosomally synthesized peptide (two-chain TOMM family)